LHRRRSDIPLLVHHFIKKVCQNEGLPEKRISPEAMDQLRAAHWPGNVRQLENTVEMAVIMSGDRELLLPCYSSLGSPQQRRFTGEVRLPARDLADVTHFDSAVNQFQLALLERALQKAGGNKTAAAGMLGMKRTTLIMKLRSLSELGQLQCAS